MSRSVFTSWTSAPGLHMGGNTVSGRREFRHPASFVWIPGYKLVRTSLGKLIAPSPMDTVVSVL